MNRHQYELSVHLMELNVNIKSNRDDRANINMWSYFLRAEDRGRSSVSETMCNETKLRYSLMNWTDRQDLSTTRKWKLQFKRTHRQIKLSTVFSPR